MPGEFTLRAFLNNKIDLTQAEAIQDLITAKNKYALNAAKNHLEGLLSKEIKKIQKELTDIAAIIEAWVDFPEEGLEFSTKEELLSKLIKNLNNLQKLVNTFENGRIIKDGLKLCIIGSPNVGKSSLMNAMLKKERAIVTKIPGTTRDILQEDLKLNDMHFQLIDTAGIRKTNCLIEKEGIKRSKIQSDEADIMLLVLDASKKLNENDKSLLKKIDKTKTIILWNKIDLGLPKEKVDFFNLCQISAKESIGLENLYSLIEKLTFKSKISNEEIIITQKRHKIALDEAITHLKKVIENLKNDISCEFISIDLKSSLKSLCKIIGFDITEDILSSIFSNFCIGK
jgi:tRNA modification GTPase